MWVDQIVDDMDDTNLSAKLRFVVDLVAHEEDKGNFNWTQ